MMVVVVNMVEMVMVIIVVAVIMVVLVLVMLIAMVVEMTVSMIVGINMMIVMTVSTIQMIVIIVVAMAMVTVVAMPLSDERKVVVAVGRDSDGNGGGGGGDDDGDGAEERGDYRHGGLNKDECMDTSQMNSHRLIASSHPIALCAVSARQQPQHVPSAPVQPRDRGRAPLLCVRGLGVFSPDEHFYRFY